MNEKIKFMTLCILGNASPSDIEEYVEKYYHCYSLCLFALREYLGFTEQEWQEYLNVPESLRSIVERRKRTPC